MKTLIIESCEKKEIKPNDSIVHAKNSLLLKNYLNCDLISHESHIKDVINKEYDQIVCVYASPYMKYNAYLEILEKNTNAEMFWLMNDHDMEDNILLRKWTLKTNKKFHMICNNPRSGYRSWVLNKTIGDKKLNDCIENWHTLNLNLLIFDENVYAETFKNKNKKDVLYYGTFRKHRVKDLLRFNNFLTFSSSKKNHEKFKNAGIEGKFIDKIIWHEKNQDLIEPFGLRLKDFVLSMYFEDEHTHTNYAFMANRFYESIMNNTILCYDARCINTINKSGYKIHPRQIVNSINELEKFYKDLCKFDSFYDEVLSYQQSNVFQILDEKNKLIENFKKALIL